METLLQQLETFGVGYFLALLILIIIIFLIIREALTWYWKTNKMIILLQRIELTLESIEHQLKAKKHKDKDEE